MKLKRTIGFFSLTNIVIANMVGAGIFTTTGLLMRNIPDPNILIILWFIGGIVALCGALSYGELGANYPLAGGEYIFLREIYHPLLGFLSGWVSFIAGFSAPTAAIALSISEYSARVGFPGIESEYLTLLKKAFAVTIILLFTFIHLRGLSRGTKVQDILTVLKIVIILILLIAGFTWGTGNFDHFDVQRPSSYPISIKACCLSLLWISYAYSGWNASTYIGSEIKNSVKNIPRSLITGTIIVMLLYVALNILFIYAIPPDKITGVIAVGGLAVNELIGMSFDKIFSVFISFALLSSLGAFIIIGPRVYYSMATKGHFFSIASYVNKYAVPSKSIIIQSGLAIVYVVSGTFEQILTFMGILLGIFPILTVLGVFILRYKNISNYKTSFFPYTQLIFLTISITILVFAYLKRPIESTIAIGILLLGIPVYFAFFRNKKNSLNS